MSMISERAGFMIYWLSHLDSNHVVAPAAVRFELDNLFSGVS